MPRRTQLMYDGTADLELHAPAPGLTTVDGRTFPLQSAAIDARAEGGLSETRLTQTYSNPYNEPLEVIYTLALPADGAVVGYQITLGDRIITGEVQPIEQARESYRKALEAGRIAGLLEQDRADTFTQKLGSLPAGVTAEVEIRVLHPLAFRSADAATSQWEYRFPTVIGVRYHGEPGRVPDQDRLDPDRADATGTPVRVSMNLHLPESDPAKLCPASRTHEIVVEPADEGGSRLRLAAGSGARLDRDVVIRWRATKPELGVRLVQGPGLAGDEGRYGLLTVTPPEQPAAKFPRDLTILMDASGSMSGWPMECSKQVVDELLGSLGPDDRFELLAFSTGVQALTRGTVKATPRKLAKARQQLSALQAHGGTEMARALTEALHPLRHDAQRQVILLTDGYIGFESEVVGNVMQRLAPGCRVHAVGIGAAPNRTLTRGVARAGRGIELFADGIDGIRSVASELLSATVAPVLTDLEVSGTACMRVAPLRPQDVLAGQPAMLAVKLNPNGGSIVVRGRMAGDRKDWIAELQIADAAESALPLGALYGREAVEDLELGRSTCRDGEADGVDAQIEEVGMRHRIATRRTSLVAVADEPSVDPREPRRRRRLELEMPAGVSAEGVGMGTRLARRLAPGFGAGIMDWMGVDETETRGRREGRRILSLREMPDKIRPLQVARRARSPINARTVSRSGNVIVVEFETPHDRFQLPTADQSVFITLRGERLEATVDEERSSHPGPHDQGLVVRLALRLSGATGWPTGLTQISCELPDGQTLLLRLDPQRN